ncbi:hypothetical protein C7121_24605 [Paenibacillus glucanolyticus]|nr:MULTISPECIES: FixH family protein [Paenibacillus]ANA83497.1 hypothetical protein A3958_20425 [Paenibacillus glucanolyticus]AVV60302.1 hypothetical protein C7121_24605 [Paenibacillus glucanolyticus]OMF67176.1 hypothetical protein BK142_28215 [Paenibacillus glucanolyticus]
MTTKKVALFAAMVLMAVALAACSDSQAEYSDDVMAEPIIVELTLTPESIQAGEKVLIQAKVTQAGNPVEDANDVEFEVTLEGGGVQAKVPVKHDQDGVYQMEKTFADAGTYRIVSHVTARGQHSMPLKELTVTE